MPDTAVRTIGRGILHTGLAATRFAVARSRPSVADAEMIALAEALLDSAQPECDPTAERAARIVAFITTDPPTT